MVEKIVYKFDSFCSNRLVGKNLGRRMIRQGSFTRLKFWEANRIAVAKMETLGAFRLILINADFAVRSLLVS